MPQTIIVLDFLHLIVFDAVNCSNKILINENKKPALEKAGFKYQKIDQNRIKL